MSALFFVARVLGKLIMQPLKVIHMYGNCDGVGLWNKTFVRVGL